MKSDDIAGIVHRFRPGLLVFVWVHCLAGFVAAHGKEVLSLDLQSWLRGLLAGGHWAVLLGGPAAALAGVFGPRAPNGSAADSPGAGVAKKTGWAALALLLVGLGLSPVFTWRYFDAYLMGVILVVAYSAPPIELAGLRFGGPAAQAFGYGALTFYAGYAASDVWAFRGTMSPLYLFGFIFLFLALHLATRPISSRRETWLYWVFLGGAFGCLAVAEVQLGGRLGTAPLVVPLVGWCAAGFRRDDAQPGEPPLTLAAALGLCLATDAALALSTLLR